MSRLDRIFLLIAGLPCAVFGSASFAQTQDPRISEVPYAPTSVYPVSISPGLASVIELQNGEAIESVVVGDALNWNVELTASADRIIVKPMPAANSTNMVVITTRRTYAFMLSTYGDGDIFLLRFLYPDAQEASEINYRYSGAKNLFPRLMTDNGQFTSIYWARDAELPAVFVVDKTGKESAAAFRVAGEGIVVEGVHERIVFRLGEDRATAQRRIAIGKRL